MKNDTKKKAPQTTKFIIQPNQFKAVSFFGKGKPQPVKFTSSIYRTQHKG
ncbi:MAG: hypothetical protein AAB685_02205 [Patescibacteria group bacterium]